MPPRSGSDARPSVPNAVVNATEDVAPGAFLTRAPALLLSFSASRTF